VSAMKVAEALKGINRLFLDTPPIIYYVQGHPLYLPLMDFVFAKVSLGIIEVATSPITLAECLVLPLRMGNLDLAERFRRIITAGFNTRYIGIDGVAYQAAELRARYNLTLLDAFQVAVALKARCDALLTNDEAFKRVHELTILLLNELEI